MKSNKNISNNDYFIEKWCVVHFGVLSETLGLKRPPNFFSTLGVPIRYRVLNDKDLTIGVHLHMGSLQPFIEGG